MRRTSVPVYIYLVTTCRYHLLNPPCCSVSALNLISALAMCVAGEVDNKIEGQSYFRGFDMHHYYVCPRHRFNNSLPYKMTNLLQLTRVSYTLQLSLVALISMTTRNSPRTNWYAVSFSQNMREPVTVNTPHVPLVQWMSHRPYFSLPLHAELPHLLKTLSNRKFQAKNWTSLSKKRSGYVGGRNISVCDH